MREDGPRPRDVAAALALAALLLLAGAVVGELAARVVSNIMLRAAVEDLVRSGRELQLPRLFWSRLLIGQAGVLLGAVLGGGLVARRLLRAGEFPGRRLYLLAGLAPLVLSLLAVGGRIVGGVAAGELAIALVLEATGVAGALLGCWWVCRRWQVAAGSLSHS